MILFSHFKNFFKTIFNFKIAEIRQGYRIGIISVLCLYVNEKWLKSDFPGWVLITSIVCLQANLGATIRKSKQRLLGTVFGCALAFLMTYFFKNNISLSIIFLIFSLFFAAYNSLYGIYSYTYTVFFLTFGFVYMYSSLFPDGEHFFVLRVEDVALGALFGTLGSLLLWPEFARKTFRNNLIQVVSETENLFLNIISWMDGKVKESKVYEQKVLSATTNQDARNKIIEIYHELAQGTYPLIEYEAFILSQESIHYSLLSIYNSYRAETFEKKGELILFGIEQLTAIQNYYRACVVRLPLTKEKAFELLKNGDDLGLLEKLENDAINALSLIQSDSIKKRSLFERLLQEVKVMNAEIYTIIDYYTK